MSDNNGAPWEDQDDFSVDDSEMEQLETEAKSEVAAQQERVKKAKEIPDSIYDIEDLLLRTRELKKESKINWADMKAVGEGLELPEPKSDMNRRRFFEALFDKCSGRVPHPYYDTFKQALISHNGRILNEQNSPAREMAECLNSAGMKKQTFNSIDESYKRFALDTHINSVQKRIIETMPQWDGASRLEEYLLIFFKLRDTPLNRKVAKYFWLSLYMRLMHPGCQAPVSIALIGDQDVGKSYFSTRIVRTILGDDKSAPTALSLNDISRNLNDWLRRITGNSIIANIGEMRGYKKADIEEIKEFTTRTTDNMHQKFFSGTDVPRQWIIILDSNTYEGFNRDETGNRRFYPFFVNQIEDKDGQPQWDKSGTWRADFSMFDQAVWMLMAECHEWVKENSYDEFVGEVSREVRDFNAHEMALGRGTIKDESTEAALQTIILAAHFQEVDRPTTKGTFVSNAEIQRLWNKTQRGSINFQAIKRLMTTIGFEQKLIGGFGRGYFLEGVADVRFAKFCYWKGGKVHANENDMDKDGNFEREFKEARKLDADNGF